LSGSNGSKGLLGFYFGTSLVARILVATALGAAVGLALGPQAAAVKPLGDLLLRLLRMIVVPVVFFSLVVGASSVSPSRLGSVGIKLIAYYTITTALAVTVGLLFANLLKPGLGLVLEGTGGATLSATPPSLVETLLNVVPTNPVEALAGGNMLQIIFFALLLGIGISTLSESQDPRLSSAGQAVFKVCEGGAEAMYKITKWIMEYAPIGVFALIATVFSQQGSKVAGPLAMALGTVYLAFGAHMVVIYGAALKAFGLNPLGFFRRAREAMITAFVTRSSSATLPVTMEVSEEMLGVSKGIFSFTLPLGATINMDGTAIYQGVCVMFVANCMGQALSLSQQLTVILTATLASIGTAGVPGAGAIMLLMVLNSVGISVSEGTAAAAAYAMILGIDSIMDMGRTLLNVTGDMVGTVVVAKGEGELDGSKWD